MPENSRLRRACDGAIWLILDQWFLIALGIVIAIASQVQVAQSQLQLKQTVVTYLCVAIIFFITGCTLPTQVLLDNYSRWKVHLFVQVQCFLMTSAVIFGIVSACATNKNFMDAGLLIGLIFTGCVPTTISSNIVMTRKADGNDALTVVQSTIGNFLGPFLTPPLVQMYISTHAWYTDFLPHASGGYSEIYRRVFKQLGLSVFLPMVVGQVVRYFFPKVTRKVFIEWKLNKLGSFSLLVIIWQTFDQAFGAGAFASVKGSNLVFIVFISIAYFLIWLAVCLLLSIPWLPKEDTVAVAYCVPAKTPAMGVPLSNLMFVGLTSLQQSKIQIPMVIFQGLQIAMSSMLTVAFRKWIHSGKPKEEESLSEDHDRDSSVVANGK
ncbi:hypothetical protein DTO164E3_48 [Paecilomyces variotii]|nr:hypothetical protein DTO032I3_3095 [Paecilomyces variotii]KAJ9207762.1 hypothetical protein DTO164E3_48 [Paecilomyces variotii]KAJ9245961.1 hypothetical protein DTO169E5_85 [Paecilomyces variotii]KAJ9251801.1 hypothetical protein DTO207G8_5255 [Paecilomyces variotii]KAJ9280689.1 hypothetical protein DTO021D3_2539 [Paecilomyces variotii]